MWIVIIKYVIASILCSVRHIIGASIRAQRAYRPAKHRKRFYTTRTMYLCFLYGNMTKYRNLLEKELGYGMHLLQEDTEQGEVKVRLKNVKENCINMLNYLHKKFDETSESMSIVVDRHEDEEDILDLIKHDWDYISTVMDCRDELVNLHSFLQEYGSPKEKRSTIIVTDERLN